MRFDLGWLRQFAALAVEECAGRSVDNRGALAAFPEVEVAIVSDRVIAEVHKRFMQISGATDVITFQHGELVISADTALECATQLQHSVEEELALYIVHGLLHLAGFDDTSAAAAARMHKRQARIFKVCLTKHPPP